MWGCQYFQKGILFAADLNILTIKVDKWKNALS